MTPDARRAAYHAALIEDALAYLDDADVAVQIGHLVPGLRLYLADRIETGGFLRSCLENRWAEAVAFAHPTLRMCQMKTLQAVIVTFPQKAWGSPEKVGAWLNEADPEVETEIETNAND